MIKKELVRHCHLGLPYFSMHSPLTESNVLIYSLQLEEGWLDDERNEFIEELNLEMLEEPHNEAVQYAGNEVEQVGLTQNAESEMLLGSRF